MFGDSASKTPKEYYKQIIDEWAKDRDDMTEMNNAILDGSFKGSALEKMKNAKGKIKGTRFPFEPESF